MPLRKSPPNVNPTTAGSQDGISLPCDISIEGISRDQQLAAIITPPVKPNIMSNIFRLISRKKKTGEAPRAVILQVKQVAKKACITGCRP